jgi:hypothetical protein
MLCIWYEDALYAMCNKTFGPISNVDLAMLSICSKYNVQQNFVHQSVMSIGSICSAYVLEMPWMQCATKLLSSNQ